VTSLTSSYTVAGSAAIVTCADPLVLDGSVGAAGRGTPRAYIGESGSFPLVELRVELRGLEPLTRCLQSDVYVCRDRADLVSQLPVGSRSVPLVAVINGTLMARRLDAGAGSFSWRCQRLMQLALAASQLRDLRSGARPASSAPWLRASRSVRCGFRDRRPCASAI
jgi:hypothetical protein